jgi:hypothetical protein
MERHDIIRKLLEVYYTVLIEAVMPKAGSWSCT